MTVAAHALRTNRAAPRKAATRIVHSLVVGGTRGIGRAVVETFAEQGHRVSVIGRRPPSDDDRRRPNVRYWVADVSDAACLNETLEAALDSHGSVSRVVFLQRYRGDGDNWAGEIETSLTATKTIIERLRDRFDPAQENAIVMVSSVASPGLSPRSSP